MQSQGKRALAHQLSCAHLTRSQNRPVKRAPSFSTGVGVRAVLWRSLRNPTRMESSAASEATETELAFQRAEFLAEDELIEINPMVKSDVITLVRGMFGPFEPSITTAVC